MDLDTIMLEAEESMEKSIEYLKKELRGLRTGRASPALVEYVKVEAYGSEQEVRQLARISVPEATTIAIKAYDKTTVGAIVKGIEKAGLGLNPQADGDTVRVTLPALSGDRRKQLVNEAKKYGEDAKIAVRNARRDANKHVDQLGKDKDSGLSEDDVKSSKEDVQELLKKYEAQIDQAVDAKAKEILEV